MSIWATEEKDNAISSTAVYIEMTNDAVPRSDHGGSMYALFCCGPAPGGSEPADDATKEPAGSSSMSPPYAEAPGTAGWWRGTRSCTLVFFMMGLRAVAAVRLVTNESLMF